MNIRLQKLILIDVWYVIIYEVQKLSRKCEEKAEKTLDINYFHCLKYFLHPIKFQFPINY